MVHSVRRQFFIRYLHFKNTKLHLLWHLRFKYCGRNVGAVVGGVLVALILVGVVIVAIVFLRRQWARSEENKARINARLAGEDEILVSICTMYIHVSV